MNFGWRNVFGFGSLAALKRRLWAIATSDGQLVSCHEPWSSVFRAAADDLTIDGPWLILTGDGQIVTAYQPTRAILEGVT